MTYTPKETKDFTVDVMELAQKLLRARFSSVEALLSSKVALNTVASVLQDVYNKGFDDAIITINNHKGV